MTKAKHFRASALGAVLLAGFAVSVVAGDAHAQAKAGAAPDKKATTGKMDKNLASKKGVAGSLGNKEIDGNQLPGKFEIGLALGSVAAMIAAIKYL